METRYLSRTAAAKHIMQPKKEVYKVGRSLVGKRGLTSSCFQQSVGPDDRTFLDTDRGCNEFRKGLSRSTAARSQCIGQRGETDGFRYRSNEEERSQEENVAGHDHDGTPRERERESLGGYAVASTSSLSQSEEPRTSLRVETTTWIDPSPSYGRWDNGGRGAEHPFQRKAMIWFFGSASKAASTVVVAETFTMLILESNSTNLDSLSSSRMVCKRRWWCWAFA